MTAQTSIRPASSSPARRDPFRAIRIGVGMIGYEARAFFRQGDTVFFTFLFPLLFLTIFSVAFSSGDFGRAADGTKVTAAWYYLPGMLAAGVLLTGVQNLGIGVAQERSDGTLKRLGGTPMPVAGYLIGKVGAALLTGILQAAMLILVANVVFGVPLPAHLEQWWRFAWVFLLGVPTCALLGIALSRLPRSGKSATAVIIPISLVLQFISGVYLQYSLLPEWLRDVASAFPLRWLAQGMRSAFLPDSYGAAEPDGGWNLIWVFGALAIWAVLGSVLTAVTFRWIRKDS